MNPISIGSAVIALLNNTDYLTDPYPGTRPTGHKHFFDENDGVSLNRGFPKGYVKVVDHHLQNSGWGAKRDTYNKQEVIIIIFYYVKEKTKSNDTATENEAYVQEMLFNIQNSLLENASVLRENDIHLKPNSITSAAPVTKVRGTGRSQFNLFKSAIQVSLQSKED